MQRRHTLALALLLMGGCSSTAPSTTGTQGVAIHCGTAKGISTLYVDFFNTGADTAYTDARLVVDGHDRGTNISVPGRGNMDGAMPPLAYAGDTRNGHLYRTFPVVAFGGTAIEVKSARADLAKPLRRYQTADCTE